MKISHAALVTGAIVFSVLCGFKGMNLKHRHIYVDKTEKISREAFGKILTRNNGGKFMASIKYPAATVNTAPSFAPVTNTCCFASIPGGAVDSKHFISAQKSALIRIKALDSK